MPEQTSTGGARTERTYAVEGMTCGHCAAAVTREVGRLAGIDDVRVDVGGGTLTVRVTEDVSDDAVAAAVDEAGYSVVASR